MHVPEPGREKDGEGEESVMIKTTCPLWRSLRSHYGQNAREKRVRNKRRQPSGMPTRSLRRSGMERRADKFVDYSFERSSGFLLSWFRDLILRVWSLLQLRRMSSKGVTIENRLLDRLTSQPVPMAGINPGIGWMTGISPARGSGWRWRMPDRSGWLSGVGERRIPNLSFCSLSEAKRKNS